MLPHKAYIVVLIRIVIHVLSKERIVLIFSALLSMEHVVLDIRNYSVVDHMCIVLFASVSGVRAHLITLLSISVTERRQERYERALVSRSPVDAIVGDELVLGGYLDVVSRLCLPVVHRVLLHTHERGIWIRLAIAVPLSEGFQLILVFLLLGCAF